MRKREQYGMVDGCGEKSHIAELHRKQALQVAAIRNRKNTKHDQSKYLGVQVTAHGIIPCLHITKYQAAHQTITQLRRARIIVTGMKPQFARLLYVTLIQCIHVTYKSPMHLF